MLPLLFRPGVEVDLTQFECDPVLRVCETTADRVPAGAWVVEREPDVPTLDGLVEAIDATALPATGRGVVGAVWDPHGPDEQHPDLAPRILRAPAHADALSHATMVGGVIAGSGAASAGAFDGWSPGRFSGVAPQTELAFYLSGGEPGLSFGEALVDAVDVHDARFAVCAYRGGIGGHYGPFEAGLDDVLAGRVPEVPRPIPFAWATANEGDGGWGTLANYVSAKNVLAVGATNVNDDSLAHFSSRGPTADGRLKPEVVAPGCYGTLQPVVLVDSIVAGTEQWTFDDDAEGWTAVNDLLPLDVVDGAVRAEATGRDPYMHSGPIALVADATPVVSITLTAPVTMAQLFWTTSDAPDWHEDRHVDVLLPGDGEPVTIEVPVGEHPGWTGVIQELRLDPAVAGVTVPTEGSTYTATCGTSIAAPAVGGVMAAMTEAVPEWRPPAAYRAALVASSLDLEGPGPDYGTGYGIVQGPAAIEAYAGTLLLDGPGMHRFEVETGETLRATLAWDDPAGTRDAVLVNDLDVVLVAPDGTEHLPWVLDPSVPDASASRGRNERDNLEVVDVDVVPGTWTVRVEGPDVPAALVVTVDGFPLEPVVIAPAEEDPAPVFASAEGCGCSGAPRVSAGVVLLGLLGLRRRR